MVYPVVVSDLDGTLLKADHQIGSLTKKVFSALVQSGIQVGIATGRPWRDVDVIQRELDVDLFLITSNGARVHNSQGDCLFRADIPASLVEALITTEAPEGARLNLYHDDAWYVTEENNEVLEDYSASGFSYRLCEKRELPREGISKLFWIADHEVLCAFRDTLQARFGNKLNILFSAPRYLEVMAVGVSKGQALNALLSQKGLSLSDAMTFGDAENDTDMLSGAGAGTLVSNACEKLKQRLPHLPIIGSHDDEAVAKHLVEHYSLSI